MNFEVTTCTFLPMGPKFLGLSGPNIPTTGVPSAEAIYVGPEALPMNRSQCLITAADCRRESLPARFKVSMSESMWFSM